MRKIVSKLMLLCISMLFVSYSSVIAGEGITANTDAGLDKLTTEWQLDREVNGVQVYLKRYECNDVMNGTYKEYVLVKMVNTTTVDMNVEWDMEMWFDGTCTTCDQTNDPEYHYTVNIPAGEVREGECSLDSARELQIFLRFLNYEHIAKLTKYNFADFQVNPR